MVNIPTLRHTLEKSSDPRQRLDVVTLLCEHIEKTSSRDAAEEILKTIKNDYSGEVVIGAAFACANLPASLEAPFQEWTLEAFKSSGSRSTSDGAPLLRLAYIAGFQFDGPTLHRMTQLRPGENGIPRIEQLLNAVSNADRNAIFRLMAFSEGLDKKYDPSILNGVKVSGTDIFQRRLTAAVEGLKKPASITSRQSIADQLQNHLAEGRAAEASKLLAGQSPSPSQSLADQIPKLLAAGRAADAGRVLAPLSPYCALEALHAMACRFPPIGLPASWKSLMEKARRFDVAVIDELGPLWAPAPPMHHGEVTALTTDRAGRLLLSGGVDGLIKIHSVDDGKQLSQYATSSYTPAAKPITFAAFLPEGTLVCACKDFKVRTFTEVGLKLIKTFEVTCAGGSAQYAVTPDGGTLASCESDASVALWSLERGELQRKLQGAERPVSSICISTDGKMIAGVGTFAKDVLVWELESGKLKYSTTPKHDGSISAWAIAPAGELMATGDDQGFLRVWRLSDGELLHAHAAQGLIAGLGFASDSTLIAVTERETVVWNLGQSPQSRPSLGEVAQSTRHCSFGSGGRLASAELQDGKDCSLILFSAEGAILHKRRISRLPAAFASADDEWMFVGLMNGAIERFKVAPLYLKAVLHRPLAKWTGKDLALVQSAARDERFKPQNTQEPAKAALLAMELLGEICPDALQREIAAPYLAKQKPWWRFW